MVEFIREKTRQYAADQSGAIRQGQLAQNVSEWNSVTQKAGNLAIDVGKQMLQDKKNKIRLQEEADEQMINTQIGSRAETELLKWNTAQIEAGVNPDTDEYTQKLYAKRDELYKPFVDQMTSEKGRATLEKQGLDTVEKIRRANIGKIASNRKKAQAQGAFFDVFKSLSDEAREYGRIGDWEGFNEATAEDQKAVAKYAEAHGLEDAEFVFSMKNVENWLLGRAETEPEEVIGFFQDKDTLKQELFDDLAKKDPSFANISEKAKDKIFEDWYKDKGYEGRLAEMLPEKQKTILSREYIKAKKTEQENIRQKMRGVDKDSKAYKAYENRIEEIQKDIDNPEQAVVDILSADVKKAILPIAKEQVKQNKLRAEKLAEDNAKGFYTMVLNPDKSVSLEAQMAGALGDLPSVENLFQHSVSDEEMKKVYDAYAEAKTDVLTRQHATFEATRSVSDKVYDFLQNSSDNDIVLMKDGLELLTEMHKGDLTQDQWQDLNNIMYGVFQDRAFGDMVSSVLEDNNRYFPDMPMALYGSQDLVPAQNISDIGLPSTNLSTLDIDAVRNYMDKESVRISKDAMAMLGKAAQLPTLEARADAVNEVSNYVATEKKKVYDNAMKTYGLDLAKLRENKRNFGQAFTQLASRVVVEYMGDDPYSGKPLFRQLDNYKEISDARKRILDGLEASKKGKEE